jgi:protein-L-isoaspartate(D-aspartate) O-methyltransferase
MRNQSLHCYDRGDWAAAQQRMVQEQLVGPGRGLSHPGTLDALRKVPRQEFVPEEQRARAWDDCALPIGFGQTISQPYIVGLMTEQLDLQPGDSVLEIGTGSGYQSAVLSRLVRSVYTIEIIAPLARRAAADLRRLGFDNVQVRQGDGYTGWPEAAPFDAIIVTCAPDHVPPLLAEQLREGGRLIIPVGPEGEQQLILLQKRQGRLESFSVLAVRFVPMTGQAQTG